MLVLMSPSKPKTSHSKALQTQPCCWSGCEKLATDSDGYCDRHAVEYWRLWYERQPDVWVDVTCWKCGQRHRIAVKQPDVKCLWPFRLCVRCSALMR